MSDGTGIILVVDDQTPIRYSVRRFLEHARFEVREAASGGEALESARRSPRPDAVVLDVKLPDVNGYEVCRRLKADPETCDLPVIHLTASYADDVSKARGLEGGADAYLTHPVEPHVLVATIRALLRLKRSREALAELLQKEKEARRTADEALLKAEFLNEELRRADRAKERFLAMLAHELRNPLEPIVTAAHVIATAESGAERRERARDVIVRQVRQMARLIDDLLDVSRINSGRIELKKETVELGALLAQITSDYRGQLEQRGLALRVAVKDAPLWLEADAARLAQVIGNLLHNAAKFTPAGGSVSIEAAPEGESARVTVTDTGIGMSEDTLAGLFVPFTQADRSLDRSLGGLGLGLTLARGLVTLHGGTIEASSGGEGRGSTLTLCIPLAKTPGAPRDQRREDPGNRRPLSVLLVEDNVDTATALADFLELGGHTTRVVYSGTEVLAVARELRPDVVLCDLGLPGMDGFGVAAVLRRSPETATAFLVALSGYGHEDDRARAKASGFDMHLTKPVDPNLLEEILLARR
jgi:signal transduction histidine kinase